VSGTAPNCDDGNPCTDDSCNPARGCVHTDNTSSCDDGNACTDDACNPATGCTHSNNSGACNDGNVCTDDSCNPATGCVFSNNTASCDDGSPCTTGDVCSAGSCAGTLTTPATHLVISQIQTNGDGATPATDEFVEIYNPTNAAISLTNYRLHLVINTFPSISTFAQNLGVGTVPAHGWLLVARSGYNGPVAADIIASASFTLSSTTDSLMLVNSMLSVTSCNPGGLVDKVAYGGGTCVEGTSATAPAANNSILRKPGGTCGNGTDAGNNVNDFVSQAPATPRNSASPPQP
jgi:hypothetical protein